MDYLKKTRMYKILTALVDDNNLDLLKNASYKSYRGTEWLEVTSKDFNNKYKMFYESKYKYFTLNYYKYDEGIEGYKEINRIVYQKKGDEWVQTYNRREAYESVRDNKINKSKQR